MSCVSGTRALLLARCLMLGAPALGSAHHPALPAAAAALLTCRHYGSRSRKHDSSSSSSDSDDDKRKKLKSKQKNKPTISEFWLRKMRTHHVAMDVNKDGVVSWDDFDQMIKRFNTTGLLKEEDKQHFEDAIRHVWEEEWGASGDPYAFINQEQFISNMSHAISSKELRKKIAKPLPFFFQAVDSDGSGEISLDEYKLYFQCLGLSEAAAIASFSSIDLNNDGKLSKKEFVKLGREFFITEDESKPSKLFWGPLV